MPTANKSELLTIEIAERIIELVKLGCYREQACAQAGVLSRQLRRWMRAAVLDDSRGKTREDSIYIDFAEKLLEAEASAENRNVATIQKAATGDWRAAAWWLEKKHASRWNDRVRQEVNAAIEQMLGDLKTGLEPELYEQVLVVIARAHATGKHSPPIALENASDGRSNADEEPPTEH